MSKKAGWFSGSPFHIRQNDTEMGKVESFILFLGTQRRGGANKRERERERPLKCNLGLCSVLSKSGGVYRLATRSLAGTTRACECVSGCKREILISDGHLFFFGSFSAHWPLCNYLWDDWECYLSLWHCDLVYLPSKCWNCNRWANNRLLTPLEHNTFKIFLVLCHCQMNCSHL